MSELMMLKCLTGLSQFILTGRSTDFEIYALDNEEQGAVINIQPSFNKKRLQAFPKFFLFDLELQ